MSNANGSDHRDIAVNTGKMAPVPQRGVAVVSVFALYDVVGMSYMEPFYMHYDAQAVRRVQDMLDQKDSMIARHASDYKLFKIGTYDINCGLLVGVDTPIFICEVASLVKVGGV